MNFSRQIFGSLSVFVLTDKDSVDRGFVLCYTLLDERIVTFFFQRLHEGLSVDFVLEGSDLDGEERFVRCLGRRLQ